MQIEFVTAWVMLISLIAYVLLGGADFGGGILDLAATLSRRKHLKRQRIRDAIGPIWEANHVWLILVIVLMFTGFPRAFAAIMTALHVPIALMLIGIVLRGSAFTFATYDRPGPAQDRWRRVFAWSSLLTPLLLGVTLGTMSSGQLRWSSDGVYLSGYFTPWLNVFAWCVGVFTMSICALLAAIYLCVESPEIEVREGFRRWAIYAQIAVAATAAVTWALAWRQAPILARGLTTRWWSAVIVILAAAFTAFVLHSLIRRRYVLARLAAVLEVTLIIFGYGVAQFPYLVTPQFTIQNASASPRMHRLLLTALAVGACVLLPSLWYLFRVFKGDRAFAVMEKSTRESQ